MFVSSDAAYTDDSLLADMDSLARQLIKRRALPLVLSRVERGIVNLCVRLKVMARSGTLRELLLHICRKMTAWLRSSYLRNALTVGRRIAEANVRAAFLMGNTQAQEWVDDITYVLHLGMNYFDSGPP